MKQIFFLLIAVGLLGGCSGAANSEKPANKGIVGSNTSAGAANLPHSLNPGDAGLNAEANGAPPGNVLGHTKRQVVDSPGSERPVLQYQPAAEDSQIASGMNGQGQMFEVRVWKRHPQLVKVESVWTDPKNKQLTYLLRTGKNLTVTTDRIENLKQATSNQLLEIAGLPQTAKIPPRPGEKKQQ